MGCVFFGGVVDTYEYVVLDGNYLVLGGCQKHSRVSAYYSPRKLRKIKWNGHRMINALYSLYVERVSRS